MGHIGLITGPERRRRWRDEDKVMILSEAFAAGARVTDVARRHDVATSVIYEWRRKALGRGQGGGPQFVEAIVPQTPARPEPAGRTAIQVELANARISIGGGASPTLVSAVLKALR